MQFTNKLISEVVAIARDMAPKDTGNLAFNAIRAFPIPGGVEIVYRGHVAPYIEYLNEGTKYSKRHVNFIGRTQSAITAHVEAHFNGSPNNMQDTFRRISQQGKDNPARQIRLLRSLALVKQEGR